MIAINNQKKKKKKKKKKKLQICKIIELFNKTSIKTIIKTNCSNKNIYIYIYKKNSLE